MEKDSYKRILKYLIRHDKALDKTYKIIILDLLYKTNFDYQIFKKMLKGAFIIIIDNGYFYNKWISDHKKIISKKNKLLLPIFSNLYQFQTIFNQSSHTSCASQYRLGNGTIFSNDNKMSNMYDILLGTNCNNLNNICSKDKCNTWFQIEKSRISNILNSLEHIFDYLTYITIKQNIGPFGISEHTETNDPIILKLK